MFAYGLIEPIGGFLNVDLAIQVLSYWLYSIAPVQEVCMLLSTAYISGISSGKRK